MLLNLRKNKLPLSEFVSTIEIVDLLDKNLNSGSIDVELLEYGESLLVQFIVDRNVSDVGCVVVVQTIDVLHDACTIGLDSCKNQQILEITMIAEYTAVQNDLLQELDQLVRQIGSHECFHRHRNILRILSFRQGRLYHL